MEITQVPVEDDEGMRQWYEMFVSAERGDHPDVPVMSFPEMLEKARGDHDSGWEDYWLGRLDRVATCGYRLRMPLRDNLDTAMLLLAVAPEHRRRGYARTLAAHAIDQVRAMGRHRIWVEVVEPVDGDPGAGALFAEKVGFRRALAQTRRVLDLAVIDRDHLAGLESDALAKAGGYELVTWTGRCPDELVEEYATLVGRLSTDAPLDDLDLEPELWDVARVRSEEALTLAQKRVQVLTAARHVASFELVAYTDIVVSEHDPGNAYQWNTIVRSDHRGHRLGLLVKTTNLRRLGAEAPRAQYVHTWNADSNRHMVAINEALGFVPLHREVEWQLDLTGTRESS